MNICIDNVTYKTSYYPFFRIEQHEDFDVYSLRYPSGLVEEIIIFDKGSPIDELETHLIFILNHYGLENDESLTPKAMELKQDVRRLFGI